MKAEEILEKLREARSENGDEVCYEFSSNYYSKELGLGEVEEVDSHGGEGQGEDWYVVAHYKEHNVFIKISGFYSSYNGTDFDGYDFEEVKPREKVITVYDKV